VCKGTEPHGLASFTGAMQNPALNPAIQLIPTENGYAAFDPTTDRLYELNPTASLIVELCDGSRSVEELCAYVEPILPEGSAGEVRRWIGEGIAGGLLLLGGDTGNAHRELSSEELHKISRRLRHRNKEQLAYICQQQATQLAPNNPDMWYDLGEVAEMLGRRDEARGAYEKYIEFKPDDAEIKHILVALRDEPPPPRVPNEALEQMYAEFSRTFEANLCGELGYKAPERVRELIDPVLGDRQNLAVLDLGCGTGLAGVQFKYRASRLIGVDISPAMIELARARNLYDRLDVAEITAWLERSSERFELIVCCDCLIYFGDLRQVLLPLADRLCPKGVLAFTLERGDRYPHRLTDSGRYAHHPEHVREVAAEAKLNLAKLEEGFLRTEYGVPVTGLFVVLDRGASHF
jgi:predicted TPR repeat methyltransferase